MHIVELSRDEWYPVYTLGEFWGGHQAVLTDEEYDKCQRVMTEFAEIQKMLKEKYQ